MKYAFVFSAAVLAAAAGASPPDCGNERQDIPDCGTGVLASIASSFGCTEGDNQCTCDHGGDIAPIATWPMVDACGIGGAKEVAASAKALCSCMAVASMLDPTMPPGASALAHPTALSSDAAGEDFFRAAAVEGRVAASLAQPTAVSSNTPRAGASVAAAQVSSQNAAAVVNSMFRGGAATAGTFAPIGGAIGFVAGLIALI